MEFQQIFVTFVVILIGTVGFITMLNYEGTAYNTNLISPELKNASDGVMSATNNTLLSIGTDQMGNSTLVGSGSGQNTAGTTQSALLVTRGLNTITILPQLLPIGGAIITSSASVLSVQAYSGLAISVFYFGFAILMAYMLIVGVRRII